jgi:hypothetical protein
MIVGARVTLCPVCFRQIEGRFPSASKPRLTRAGAFHFHWGAQYSLVESNRGRSDRLGNGLDALCL